MNSVMLGGEFPDPKPPAFGGKFHFPAGWVGSDITNIAMETPPDFDGIYHERLGFFMAILV